MPALWFFPLWSIGTADAENLHYINYIHYNTNKERVK